MVFAVMPVVDPQLAPDHEKKVAEGISGDSVYVVNGGRGRSHDLWHDAIDAGGSDIAIAIWF